MKSISRTPKQIAIAIKRYRQLKGLTQAQLSEKVKMRQATISKLEAGEETQLKTLLDVLTALDLEIVIQPRSKSSSADIESSFS